MQQFLWCHQLWVSRYACRELETRTGLGQRLENVQFHHEVVDCLISQYHVPESITTWTFQFKVSVHSLCPPLENDSSQLWIVYEGNSSAESTTGAHWIGSRSYPSLDTVPSFLLAYCAIPCTLEIKSDVYIQPSIYSGVKIRSKLPPEKSLWILKTLVLKLILQSRLSAKTRTYFRSNLHLLLKILSYSLMDPRTKWWLTWEMTPCPSSCGRGLQSSWQAGLRRGWLETFQNQHLPCPWGSGCRDHCQI